MRASLRREYCFPHELVRAELRNKRPSKLLFLLLFLISLSSVCYKPAFNKRFILHWVSASTKRDPRSFFNATYVVTSKAWKKKTKTKNKTKTKQSAIFRLHGKQTAMIDVQILSIRCCLVTSPLPRKFALCPPPPKKKKKERVRRSCFKLLSFLSAPTWFNIYCQRSERE